MLDRKLNAAWNIRSLPLSQRLILSLRDKMYIVFNLATWLGIVKLKDLNISEFRHLNFDYINYQ